MKAHSNRIIVCVFIVCVFEVNFNDTQDTKADVVFLTFDFQNETSFKSKYVECPFNTLRCKARLLNHGGVKRISLMSKQGSGLIIISIERIGFLYLIGFKRAGENAFKVMVNTYST